MRIIISGESATPNLSRRVKAILSAIAPFFLKKGYYIEINLVGDKTMKKNVLSYKVPKQFPRPDVKEKPLGEIYLNPNYIKRNHEDFDFMLIHGFLHLIGYNHKREGDRIKMEAKESELLLKIKN